jgi:hypothetical protein
MVKGRWPALGIDTSQPNIARIYDYWLGGKDNFAADDLTLVEPGLTDVWAWRPAGGGVFPVTTDFMRIIGAVGRKG